MGGKRLSEDQKSEMVRLYTETDLGAQEIAEVVGCNKSTVSAIVRARADPDVYADLTKAKRRSATLKSLIRRGRRPPSLPNGHLWCSRCETIKGAEEFHRERASPTGRMRWCKLCVSQVDKKRRSKPLHKAQVYLANATRRGIECSYTAQELLEEFGNQPCYYCGEQVDIGIDRLDNSKGYVFGNMRTCCSTCNGMKSTLDVAEFLRRCATIAARHT